MIYNISIYRDFVKRFMKLSPVTKKDVLIIALKNNFRSDYAIDDSFANSILTAMQSACEIFISNDGWVLTKGAYVSLTGDKFYDKVNWHNEYHVFDMDILCKKEYEEVNACLYIVADLLPNSIDFAEARFPFKVVFTTEESEKSPSLLYEICYVPSLKADSFRYVLQEITGYSDSEFRRHITRVAIVERQEDAAKIPYLGFRFICMLSNALESGYKIIETRSAKEMWRDYVL